jgi:hypothetical protein
VDMNPRMFLKAMILLMLIPSGICLFLPDTIAGSYTRIMYPLVLILGAVFSIRVAAIYKNWLRNAFIFLSLFLFLMIFPHFDFLWGLYRTYPQLVVLLQWVTYAMLVLCSFYVLKVTEVREITRKGWALIGAAFLIGIIILAYHVPPLYHYYPQAYKIPLTLIYFLDVVIVIMLMPVVLLYAQQMRLEGRESITFTTIISGIILSTVAVYLYVIVSGIPLSAAPNVFHTGSVLDSLYLFSYLLIAVGLYVHKKYDEWGFDMIEQALSGGSAET